MKPWQEEKSQALILLAVSDYTLALKRGTYPIRFSNCFWIVNTIINFVPAVKAALRTPHR